MLNTVLASTAEESWLSPSWPTNMSDMRDSAKANTLVPAMGPASLSSLRQGKHSAAAACEATGGALGSGAGPWEVAWDRLQPEGRYMTSCGCVGSPEPLAA